MLIYYCFFRIQIHRHCTTTITTTKNVCGAIRAAWTWPGQTRSGRAASKIKFYVICTSRTWLWWNVRILCNSYAVSSHNRWGAPLLAEKALRLWYFRCHRKPVPVSHIWIFTNASSKLKSNTTVLFFFSSNYWYTHICKANMSRLSHNNCHLSHISAWASQPTQIESTTC